jgi:hypothetical protein
MNSKHEDPKRGRWSGDAVEDAEPGEAERSAERAEGNKPQPLQAPARDDPGPLKVQPTDQHRRAPSGEEPEDKIDEAAEAHREVEREHSRRPPHGKL